MTRRHVWFCCILLHIFSCDKYERFLLQQDEFRCDKLCGPTSLLGNGVDFLIFQGWKWKLMMKVFETIRESESHSVWDDITSLNKLNKSKTVVQMSQIRVNCHNNGGVWNNVRKWKSFHSIWDSIAVEVEQEWTRVRQLPNRSQMPALAPWYWFLKQLKVKGSIH